MALFFVVYSSLLPFVGAAAWKLRGQSVAYHLAVDAQNGAQEKENAEFDAFLEDWFSEFMSRRPVDALTFGLKLQKCGHGEKHVWGDVTLEAEADGLKKDQLRLDELERRFNASIGSRDTTDERHISLLMMREKVKEMSQEHSHSDFSLPFGALGCQVGSMGCQVRVANLLHDFQVRNTEDAVCYISLLNGLPNYFDGHIQRFQEASSRGVTPYRVVLEGVIADCDRMMPSSSGDAANVRNSSFYVEFEKKVHSANLSNRSSFLKEVEAGIKHGVWPAYAKLQGFFRNTLLPNAPEGDRGLAATYGKAGQHAYQNRLSLAGRRENASQVHSHALQLVAANAAEMRRLAADSTVKLRGGPSSASSAPFSDVLVALKAAYYDQHYSDTEDGRAAYLQDVQSYISFMWSHLTAPKPDGGHVFFEQDVPQLGCDVKRIWSPSFPATAQYVAGSVGDIRRNASVSFKLTNMSLLSKAEMIALAHHEVVPGHHLQVTRALSLRDHLPGFRRFFSDENYGEGWAVYAEQDVSQELVEIAAPAKLGLLNLRQIRAIRTVVDTGLHELGWNREEAQQFYIKNSLISSEQAAMFVRRHIVWPGQQLTYLAGFERVRKVREAVLAVPELKQSLGKDWEAEMHDAMLSHGDLALSMLQDIVIGDLRTRGRHS